MAILANRVRIKNNLFEIIRFLIYSSKRFFHFILVAISCLLLYFSPPTFLATFTLECAGNVMSVGTDIYQKSIDLVNKFNHKISYYQNLEGENAKLRFEVDLLKEKTKDFSSIDLENRSLKQMLNVAYQIDNNFVTAKIIGVTISPFASYAMIGSGLNDGIKVNDIVHGKTGLVGRVTKVGNNYSTVMLIDDNNSRIPVITSNSKTRALIGKRGNKIQMIYLQEDQDPVKGEMVYTSGDGTIYPKGILIGKISEINKDGIFVKPSDHITNLEFLVVESIN